MTYAMSHSLFSEAYVARSQTDEETTIQAARAGDLEAFNTLVLKYQDRIYTLAYRILGDEAAAADAAQEAFILAYRHIVKFKEGSFFAWLYRITTNVCYDAIRYQKRRPAMPFAQLGSDDDDELEPLRSLRSGREDNPEAAVQRHELATLLQRHISALPIAQRTVLVLSDVQGLCDKEIATLMRTSIGTVKSRLNRARAKLRRSLNGVQLN
jgi:RNA polymerase sigma-70 factor (ECF subfamily)